MNGNICLASSFALGLLTFGTAAVAAEAKLIASEPTPSSADNPPRYRLEVGQELIYEGSSRFNYQGGSHRTTDRTTYWVTRQNADGSWHIVVHNENSFGQTFGKEEKEWTPERKQEAFDGFDVFADGAIMKPPQGGETRGLTELFFKLPATAAPQAVWEVEEADGDKSLYRLSLQSDAASGKWVIEKTDKGIFNEIYLSTHNSLVHFDTGRGLVTKVELEYSQGYGFNGKGTGLTELKSTTKKSQQWITQLGEQADAFAQAKAAVREAQESIQRGGNPKEAVGAAEKVLREGREKVALPIVKAQFDVQLKRLIESTQYWSDEKTEEAEVLNKAAAPWETTDIDGKKHSLTDYRGKVVVMDFWYRGCGWCIKAMPQIKEVAAHFREKPVVVLGMNTDRQETDARFVAEKLKLNYPTLKAEGLPEKYNVRGFPTLVIIDQEGVVRARHVGYSPTLREEVTKTIDGLLSGHR